MTSRNLENLAKAGQLKQEPADRKEFDGLVRSARARLNDAHNAHLAIESRFDLVADLLAAADRVAAKVTELEPLK